MKNMGILLKERAYNIDIREIKKEDLNWKQRKNLSVVT